MIAVWPSALMPTKWCSVRAEIMALTATCKLPSVPFLKPTGMETPLAISRWVWLSVVRAPIAAQLIDFEENRPSQLHSRRDIAGPVEMRVINQALPSDGGSGFFKVSPHHDQAAVTQGIGNWLQLV